MVNVSQHKKLLLVEDSFALIDVYKHALETLDLDLDVAETFSSAQVKLKKQPPDVLLLDLRLPDGDGMDLLRQIRRDSRHTQTIVITSNGSINTAIGAMRAGATNFLVKPFSGEKLRQVVVEAIENQFESLFQSSELKGDKPSGTVSSLFVEKSRRQEKPRLTQDVSGIVGNSAAMQPVYHAIKVAGPTEASVLITGKTGTGKELCAEAIHNLSNRSSNPLIVLNCAAIPKDLMESELFGHVKGSFTGATSTREGAAHLANGGSLFLDEIGEMDMALQSKLLRFVQNQTFQRVGSNKTEKVSVRFIAATNRNPLHEIEVGRFREDLYYRLNVVPIHLPELKDRGDDIILIARAFLEKYADIDQTNLGFTADVLEKLYNYGWPGNIRQLQNVVRNALIFSSNDQIEMGDLSTELMPSSDKGEYLTYEPLKIAAFAGDAESVSENANLLQIEPLHLVEQKLINLALDKFKGNVAKVANALEISASSVYRKKADWNSD